MYIFFGILLKILDVWIIVFLEIEYFLNRAMINNSTLSFMAKSKRNFVGVLNSKIPISP